MTTKVSKGEVAAAPSLTEMFAAFIARTLDAAVFFGTNAPGSAEDQGHLHKIAARDAFYAREDAIRAPHAEWAGRDKSIPMPHLTNHADGWWAGCDCKSCSTPPAELEDESPDERR